MEGRELDRWLETRFHYGICNVGVFREGEELARWVDWRTSPHWKGVTARVWNVSNSFINSKKALYTTTFL